MGVSASTDFTGAIANYNLVHNRPAFDCSTEGDGDVVRYSDIVGILSRMGRDNCWGSSRSSDNAAEVAVRPAECTIEAGSFLRFTGISKRYLLFFPGFDLFVVGYSLSL